jgi:hypothetical protein
MTVRREVIRFFLWRVKFKFKEPVLVFATGAIGLLLHGIY